MTESLPAVSVITPVYNGARSLPRLMRSLRAQDYPGDRVEILMVDNKSTDDTVEVVAGLPDANLLRFTDWPSSYASRNVGIAEASGDVLAFIDADCWAHPGWISAGVRGLADEGFDRVAGPVEFVLSQYPNIYETFDSGRNFRQGDFIRQGWSGAGNLFAWRSVFEDVGPWDERLISHGDSEFGMRATRRGKTLGFAAEAVIYHRARSSLRSLVKKWIRTEYGAAQVYRRHGLHELHLWTKKANYRPLVGVWKDFPEHLTRSPRVRFAIDGIANVLRYCGNYGNLKGYLKTPPGNAD